MFDAANCVPKVKQRRQCRRSICVAVSSQTYKSARRAAARVKTKEYMPDTFCVMLIEIVFPMLFRHNWKMSRPLAHALLTSTWCSWRCPREWCRLSSGRSSTTFCTPEKQQQTTKTPVTIRITPNTTTCSTSYFEQ